MKTGHSSLLASVEIHECKLGYEQFNGCATAWPESIFYDSPDRGQWRDAVREMGKAHYLPKEEESNDTI